MRRIISLAIFGPPNAGDMIPVTAVEKRHSVSCLYSQTLLESSFDSFYFFNLIRTSNAPSDLVCPIREFSVLSPRTH